MKLLTLNGRGQGIRDLSLVGGVLDSTLQLIGQSLGNMGREMKAMGQFSPNCKSNRQYNYKLHLEQRSERSKSE